MNLRAILAALPILAVLAAGPVQAAPADSLELVHPTDELGRRVSGDGSTLITGGDLMLSARVLGPSGQPVAGVPVRFTQVAPREEHLGSVLTDREGVARYHFQAGDKRGTCSLTASISQGREGADHLVYRLPVRRRAWVAFMLFGLVGGLGLFLFGMEMMSASLQRSTGARMRAVLGALTRNRVLGVVLGAFVTMVVQSSSATTVLLVSFVQARLMTFAQTLGVILGADIGTTVTAQLIAFHLTDYSLLMIGLGFAVKVLSRREGLRSAGDLLLSFGLLFFGMGIMSEAMAPLRAWRPFLDLLAGLENPVAGILVGAAFTALIQSSGAFAGLVIVLAQQQLLTLQAGIPLIFGANIGTCITALLASIRAGREAKRVALAHTLFKVLGVLLFVAWIPHLAWLVRRISPEADLPRQIANAHTIFNLGLTLVFLPFTGLFARALTRLLPDRPERPEPKYQARHLDRSILPAPALALNLAKVEILRMGEVVRSMIQEVLDPFFGQDLDLLDRIHDREKKVDELEKQISSYLIDIGKQRISQQQAEEVYMMMHVTKQYELIADIIDKELRPLAGKKASRGLHFSDSGAQEVRAYHLKMTKQISRSLDAFRDGSLEKARRMEDKEIKYEALEEAYRQAHYERVRREVQESVETSEFHLDLMDSLRKINNYSMNIARALLAADSGDDEETSGDSS